MGKYDPASVLDYQMQMKVIIVREMVQQKCKSISFFYKMVFVMVGEREGLRKDQIGKVLLKKEKSRIKDKLLNLFFGTFPWE